MKWQQSDEALKRVDHFTAFWRDVAIVYSKLLRYGNKCGNIRQHWHLKIKILALNFEFKGKFEMKTN